MTEKMTIKEMTRLGKGLTCLAHKHNDLNLDPRT